MIKALLMIFAPSGTWERIGRARRNFAFVLFLFLIPTVALSVAGEIAGRNYLAQQKEEWRPNALSQHLALNYGAAEAAAGLLVVFLCASMVKVISETFHTRNTYAQCFVMIAYASGPFFLFHLLDAVPDLTPWISLGVGVFFTFATIYYAVPNVLKPDPPHAFGLYLLSGIFFALLSVLARLFTLQVLQGKITLF